MVGRCRRCRRSCARVRNRCRGCGGSSRSRSVHGMRSWLWAPVDSVLNLAQRTVRPAPAPLPRAPETASPASTSHLAAGSAAVAAVTAQPTSATAASSPAPAASPPGQPPASPPAPQHSPAVAPAQASPAGSEGSRVVLAARADELGILHYEHVRRAAASPARLPAHSLPGRRQTRVRLEEEVGRLRRQLAEERLAAEEAVERWQLVLEQVQRRARGVGHALTAAMPRARACRATC